MDIDSLTIKEAREAVERGNQIAKMLGGKSSAVISHDLPPNSMLGKYVIVRCRDAGVHAGVLESIGGRECTLTDSRRLWRWRVPKGKSEFLSGVALYGLADDCKIGAPVPRILLTENCEVIETTADAEQSIRTFATCIRTQ